MAIEIRKEINRGGSGFHDRTLAVKSSRFLYIFLHIFYSYAKILRETNFQPRELPQSGSKAEDVGRKERRKAKVSDNNGQFITPEPISNIISMLRLQYS